MSNVKKKADDLWTLIEREPYENTDEGDTTTLFVGKYRLLKSITFCL